MGNTKRILIVDDEKGITDTFKMAPEQQEESYCSFKSRAYLIIQSIEENHEGL